MKSAMVSSIGNTDTLSNTRVTQTENAVWILCGEAPIEPRQLLNPDGDEIWYIDTIDAFLKLESASEPPVQELIEAGIHHVSDLFIEELGEQDLDVAFFPSAMLSFVRFDLLTAEMEYFCLGDTVVMIEIEGSLHRVCANDNNTEKPMGAKWGLSFTPDAVDSARYGTLNLDDVSKVHLFNGAVDRAVAAQDEHFSWENVLDKIATEGVQYLASTTDFPTEDFVFTTVEFPSADVS